MTNHSVPLSTLNHPYFPPSLDLPSYVANDIPFLALIASFSAACCIVIWATSITARTLRPNISKADTSIAVWFVLCGCIHLFFEGYFVYNNADLASRQHLFAQLWKEYALSDRRYLTRDSFVCCVEGLTAFIVGPLSFLMSFLVMQDSPFRHPLQIIVSMGQLYGDVLYFATCFFDHKVYGAVYSRPETLYFWVYFVTLNAFWIVIPFWLIYGSSTSVVEAVRGQKKLKDM